MLITECYWIAEAGPYRLALMPRPRSGEWLDDEIAGWRRAGINTVVSLLEPHEIRELELKEERTLCETNAIEFLSFPIPDRGVPSSVSSMRVLVDRLVASLKGGNSVAVHCRAGIGRSGVVTACILLQLGVPFENVFAVLSRSRRLPVPDTVTQVQWVEKYAHKTKNVP